MHALCGSPQALDVAKPTGPVVILIGEVTARASIASFADVSPARALS